MLWRRRALSSLLLACACANAALGGVVLGGPDSLAYVDSDCRRVALGDGRIAWGRGGLVAGAYPLSELGGIIPPSRVESLAWVGETLLVLTRAHGLMALDAGADSLVVAHVLPLDGVDQGVDLDVVGQTAFAAGYRNESVGIWRPTTVVHELAGRARPEGAKPRRSDGAAPVDVPSEVSLGAA